MLKTTIKNSWDKKNASAKIFLFYLGSLLWRLVFGLLIRFGGVELVHSNANSVFQPGLQSLEYTNPIPYKIHPSKNLHCHTDSERQYLLGSHLQVK